MGNFLIPLFYMLAIIALYPLLMIYVALVAQAGFFGTCFIFAVMASPIVALWYYVEKQNMRNDMELLFAQPHVWDINKSLEEYVELLKKKRKTDGVKGEKM